MTSSNFFLFAVSRGSYEVRTSRWSDFVLSFQVFLGGVPWDITENDLQCAFGRFGNPKIEWPAAHDSSSRNVKGALSRPLTYFC